MEGSLGRRDVDVKPNHTHLSDLIVVAAILFTLSMAVLTLAAGGH